VSVSIGHQRNVPVDDPGFRIACGLAVCQWKDLERNGNRGQGYLLMRTIEV
jgi:hypothetical protein